MTTTLYELKPIEWKNNVDSEFYHSPTHKYTIRHDSQENAYVVVYLNKEKMTSDVSYFPDVESAKEWVEKIHVPAKLKEWFYAK